MHVRADDVAVDLGRVRVVTRGVLQAAPGAVVGLIGPNGCGKTSLLRTVYRSLRPTAGRVLVGDCAVWELRPRAAARRTAAVLQDDPPEFEFTVTEVVGLGRVPHRGALDRTSVEDTAAVGRAMHLARVDHLAQRPVRTLSGGERQRVYLARALAQETPVLVLDEPTNHLDISAQIELLDLLVGLPVTVVAALHDLNLAAAYCDQLFLMDAGELVTHGPPAEVLTPERLAAVYGVRAHVGANPLTGRPWLHFAPPLRPAPEE